MKLFGDREDVKMFYDTNQALELIGKERFVLDYACLSRKHDTKLVVEVVESKDLECVPGGFIDRKRNYNGCS